MAFYHEIKEHMSPSALAQWINGRGQFTRSYFAQEKGPTTKAMSAGTEIHALIEAGVMKAKYVFKLSEEEVRVQVPGSDFWFMGKPDSYELNGGNAVFVDYKSGKANGWDEKLPVDIKMRATAWLVWIKTGCPDGGVMGHIEFIQTTWDPNEKKVVAIEGKETEVVSIFYGAPTLEQFTKVVIQEMTNVNDFYEKWKESTGEFVSADDMQLYAKLKEHIDDLESKQKEVMERILGQMDFGGVENVKSPLGTFFVRETTKYQYPPDLSFMVDGMIQYTLEEAERIASGAKAAKTNYELATEPVSVTRSVTFRPAKK